MNKLKLLSVAVVGLLLLNLALIIFLFLNKPTHLHLPIHPPEQQEGPKNIIIEQLHFNSEQITTYENLINEHQHQIKELDKLIREAKNNLYQEFNFEASTKKDSLIQLLSSYQSQIEDVHYNHFLAIKKLCKPEQLAAFEKLTKNLAYYFRPNKNQPPPKEN